MANDVSAFFGGPRAPTPAPVAPPAAIKPGFEKYAPVFDPKVQGVMNADDIQAVTPDERPYTEEEQIRLLGHRDGARPSPSPSPDQGMRPEKKSYKAIEDDDEQ